MKRPALVVPELEGGRESGNISHSGNVIYANLVIKPGMTEGLCPEAGYNLTYMDTRYIRNWELGPPKNVPFGREVITALPSMQGTLNNSDLADSTVQWTPITAESRGIINVSRKYGAKEN